MRTNQKSLEDRVRRLERQNRAWMCICALVGSGALLAVAQPDPIPNVIRAKSFEVVSDHGIAVASLRSTNQGGMIAVNDIGGSAKVTLGINGDLGGLISANNEQGDPLVLLEARSNMNNLKLAGRSALDALVESELWGRIAVNSASGRSVFAANGFPDSTSLLISHPQSQSRVSINAEGHGSVLKVTDGITESEIRDDSFFVADVESEKPMVTISASGGGMILLSNGEAEPSINIDGSSSPSSFTLFNPFRRF